LKHLPTALAVAGLALITAMVAYYGIDTVEDRVFSIGWRGFVLLLLLQTGLFVVTGCAWHAIIPRRRRKPGWLFVWGRVVRDAAANCLPFSQMGGFLLGARATTFAGVGWPLAAASTVVDVTAEFLAQVAFATIGLSILLIRAPDSVLMVPLAIGLVVSVAGGATFIWLQRGASPVFVRLGRKIAGQSFDSAEEWVEAFQGELDLIYGNSRRLAWGSALHLGGWMATGAASWVAYRLIGVPLDLPAALAIEALLNVVLTVAFLVPGYAGIQEAAYAGFGLIFGVPPEVSLSMSLLRRARDFTLGIPALLAYQLLEVRRLRIIPPP
jgi:glycosyltransferase 2 family protein